MHLCKDYIYLCMGVCGGGCVCICIMTDTFNVSLCREKWEMLIHDLENRTPGIDFTLPIWYVFPLSQTVDWHWFSLILSKYSSCFLTA